MTSTTTTWTGLVALLFFLGCGGGDSATDAGGQSGNGTQGPPSGCMKVSASLQTPPQGEQGYSCGYSVSGCPNESTYAAKCETATDDGPLTCQCSIDDQTVGKSFEFAGKCPASAADLKALCSWE